MVPADLVDVLALEHDLFPDDPWTAQMFADEVSQPSQSRLYLIAEGDGTDGPPPVAGYAGLMFVPGGTQADVLTIAVAQEYWARGLSSRTSRKTSAQPRSTAAAISAPSSAEPMPRPQYSWATAMVSTTA